MNTYGVILTDEDIQIDDIKFSPGSINIFSTVEIILDKHIQKLMEDQQMKLDQAFLNGTYSLTTGSPTGVDFSTLLSYNETVAIAEALNFTQQVLKNVLTEEIPENIIANTTIINQDLIITEESKIEQICACEETGCVSEDSFLCNDCPDGYRQTVDSSHTNVKCELIPVVVTDSVTDQNVVTEVDDKTTTTRTTINQDEEMNETPKIIIESTVIPVTQSNGIGETEITAETEETENDTQTQTEAENNEILSSTTVSNTIESEIELTTSSLAVTDLVTNQQIISDETENPVPESEPETETYESTQSPTTTKEKMTSIVPHGTKTMPGNCNDKICPKSSQCKNLNSGDSICACNENFFRVEDPESGDLLRCQKAFEVVCPSDLMILNVYSRYLQDLDIDIDSLKFNGNRDCLDRTVIDGFSSLNPSVTPGLEYYQYRFNLNENCGTTVETTNTTEIYTNGASFKFNDNSIDSIDPYEKIKHRHVEFKCSYNRTSRLTLGEIPIQIMYKINIDGEGIYEATLQDFADDQFQQPFEREAIFKDDPVFIKVESKTNATNTNRTIHLNSCQIWNHHLKYENNPEVEIIKYDIIENGCGTGEHTSILADPTTSTESDSADSLRVVKFSSKIFEVAETFNQAYVVCDVLFCNKNSCPKPDCQQLGFGSNSRSRRSILRKKRAIKTYYPDDTIKMQIVAGPYELAANSKTVGLMKASVFSVMAWIGIAVGAIFVILFVTMMATNRMKNIYRPQSGVGKKPNWAFAKKALRLTAFKQFGSETDISSNTSIDNYFDNFQMDFLDDSEMFDDAVRKRKYVINSRNQSLAGNTSNNTSSGFHDRSGLSNRCLNGSLGSKKSSPLNQRSRKQRMVKLESISRSLEDGRFNRTSTGGWFLILVPLLLFFL